MRCEIPYRRPLENANQLSVGRLPGLIRFLLILFTLTAISGCEERSTRSLFDADEQLGPRPVVSRFEPPDSTFAGAGELLIFGENFSSTPEENLVFFNEIRAQILSASKTEIRVLPPNLVADSIRIRVAVQGAELFSPDRFYKLIAAVSDFGDIFDGDIAYGIASDSQGNIFYHVVGKAIKKTAPDNTTTDFAVPRFLRANALKMGPDDVLYAAPSGRIKQIATFASDGTESSFVSLGSPALPEPRDLDFDADLNLWVVGGPILFLVKSDKTVLQVANFPLNLLSIRVFDNFVYVAGDDIDTGVSKLVRAPIQGDGVGNSEEVLDLNTTEQLQGDRIQAVAISEDGSVILGTTNTNGIFVLTTAGTLEPLFPGLIAPQIYALSWGSEQTSLGDGQILYAVRQRPSPATANSFDFSLRFSESAWPPEAPPILGANSQFQPMLLMKI